MSLTWTPVAHPGGPYYGKAFTSGTDLFVADWANAPYALKWSTDYGGTWSTVDDSQGNGFGPVNALAKRGNSAVIARQSPHIMRTADMSSWSIATDNPFGDGSTVAAIGASPTEFLAVSVNGTGLLTASSADGATWAANNLTGVFPAWPGGSGDALWYFDGAWWLSVNSGDHLYRSVDKATWVEQLVSSLQLKAVTGNLSLPMFDGQSLFAYATDGTGKLFYKWSTGTSAWVLYCTHPAGESGSGYLDTFVGAVSNGDLYLIAGQHVGVYNSGTSQYVWEAQALQVSTYGSTVVSGTPTHIVVLDNTGAATDAASTLTASAVLQEFTLDGFLVTAIGSPVSVSVQPVSGFCSTEIGSPTSASGAALASSDEHLASGLKVTKFGKLQGKHSLATQMIGVAVANFGESNSSFITTVVGFSATQLGDHSVTPICNAAGVAVTRFGSPAGVRAVSPGGILSAAFGQAFAKQKASISVEGLQGSNMGSPSAVRIGRAFAYIAPPLPTGHQLEYLP